MSQALSLIGGLIVSFQLLATAVQGDQNILLTDPVTVSVSAGAEIFPKRWRSSTINANAEPLSDSEKERSVAILETAFTKYPKKILQENLDVVYVVKRLKYRGISAGGTNSRKRVYLANRGKSAGYTNVWVEGAFHAEFSSILLRNFPEFFDHDAWTNANGENFEYGFSGVDAVQQGKARKRFEKRFHEEGFLHQYAKSTLENDFNAISELLFTGNPRFWSVVDEHAKVRIKVEIAVQFYEQIDSSFSMKYFESLKMD